MEAAAATVAATEAVTAATMSAVAAGLATAITRVRTHAPISTDHCQPTLHGAKRSAAAAARHLGMTSSTARGRMLTAGIIAGGPGRMVGPLAGGCPRATTPIHPSLTWRITVHTRRMGMACRLAIKAGSRVVKTGALATRGWCTSIRQPPLKAPLRA